MLQLPILSSPIVPLSSIIKPVEQSKEPPKPKIYIVMSGDYLAKIAQDQGTTIQRLFDKNTSVTDPNVINPGQELVIPISDEELTDRQLPTQNVVVEPARASQTSSSTSSGNLYDYGYCTYFVKNMRPDVPNNWGDASSWYSNAQAQGWSVGSTPRVGAIAWAISYGHVAYVTAVSGDQVTVEEENYQGWNVVSSRTTSSSEFLYIY